MTEIRQVHHHPISAEDARDVKPWRLPYWTEPPAWEAEKAEQEAAQQAAARQAVTDEQGEPLAFPTAEELENIRREAYNDGLEQGLVEGRQQGHKEGFEAGRKEGYDAAFAEGRQAGYDEGLQQGNEAGRLKAQADTNLVVTRLQRIAATLHSHLEQRDQQLPEVLAGICSRVLGEELRDGAVNILQFVQRALAELPGGEKDIRVVIGPDDARHLQNSLELTGTEMHYRVDDKLPAGSCRVETEHSLVEYSSQDYLNQLLDNVLTQMMQQSVTFPDADEQAQWEEPLAPPPAEPVAEEPAAEPDQPHEPQ